MLTLILQRLNLTSYGTYGVLMKVTEVGNVPIALTLEDPWNNNEPFKSCIPANNYVCEKTVSPKFGDTFEITGILGRDHVLFHSGNTIDDTHGCVLLGQELNFPNAGIANSRIAFKVFMDLLEGSSQFNLIIKNPA